MESEETLVVGQIVRIREHAVYAPQLAGERIVVRYIYEDLAGDGSTCAFVYVPSRRNVVSVAVSDLEGLD